MPTTLTRNAVTVVLHDDLDWTDEFDWYAMQRQQTYTAAGAQIIDVGVKLAGRSVTLAGGPDRAWVTRATALALKAWVELPNLPMSLLFRGVTYSVTFAPVDTPLSVTHVADYSDPSGADFVYITLRLVTL